MDPDVKARIICEQTTMNKFRLLFSAHLSKIVLKCTGNFSQVLQKHSMSAVDGQGVAELTVTTLKKTRSNEAYTQPFDVVGI